MIRPVEGKAIRGGWAVTLKSAAQEGLPVSLGDPRYLDPWRYASMEMMRKRTQTPYDEAVMARWRQEAA